MSEAFNSTIIIARGKPVVTMFEEIRVYLMERWEANRQKIARYEDEVLPNIKKRIARESSYTNNWMVRRSSEYDYEVRRIASLTEKYSVNLLRRECDCRKWLLTGLPCCHAISCMKSQDININDFVPDCFKKERYAACYSSVIYPANGQCLWEKTPYADLQPPPIKRQAGRPKKKRTRDANEMLDANQMKRAKWGIKCSRCKQSGHNKSTCKLPAPPPASEGTTGQNPTPATAPSSSQTRSVHPPQPATAPSSSQRRSVQPPQPAAAPAPAPATVPSSNIRRRKGKQHVSATQAGQPKKKKGTARGKGSTSSQP